MAAPADRILGWLRAASAPLSGEELAERLGISRAAVHKHVEALRSRGYAIDAQHAQGYVLARTPDRLDATELGPHLTGTWRHIEWRAELDSTQRLARELARDGAEEGTVVIAETQTAGRGRLGRTWYSPPGVNLYCSVVLRPTVPPSTVPQVALVAALPVARAIAEATSRTPALKWPNDVLLEGRKVVGILTEMEAELEQVRFVIVGIGVNVNVPADAFPPDLRARATSLAIALGRPIDRVRFTASLLAHLESDYRRFLAGGFAAVRHEWQRASALQGHTVTVRSPDGDLTGEVTGLAPDGALCLRDQSGQTHRIVAGEVTTRSGR
jgi:BirA family biotin operon repressor/biotin-[acetyl-CoA-carboxylase] ligase